MKTLICSKKIEKINKDGGKVIYYDDNTIITEAARDLAKGYNMEFLDSNCTSSNCVDESKDCSTNNCDTNSKDNLNLKLSEEMIYNALKNMIDKGMIDISSLGSMINEAYLSETHNNGLKVVKGNTVRMDVLDTGNSKDKVFYQEVVCPNDSKINAGFLTIEKSEFNWEIACDEIYNVIEGSIIIKIDGKTYNAVAGDVVFFPVGSKIVLSSPNKARIFYTTAPSLS